MNFNEHNTLAYDWDDRGVYIIELSDYVEGGEEGVSNRQAKELTARTRNLHQRVATAEGEIDTLQEQTPIRVETALTSAKTYADGKDTVLRNDMAIADTSTLNTAKTYANQVVAALVDNSPEALNTLQELAAALGGDPNFATTVMQAIGERMKSADVNAALVGKADINGSKDKVFNATYFEDNQGRYNIPITGIGYTDSLNRNNTHRFCTIDHFKSQLGLYHTGNLTPATPSAPGLMSKEDKAKLDELPPKIIRGSVNANGYTAGGNAYLIEPLGNSIVRVTHRLGNTNYSAIATVNCGGIAVPLADNEVNIWTKTADYVEFVVTNGTGGDREFAPFDFIIIPY